MILSYLSLNTCDGEELFFNDDPGSGDSGEADTLLCNNDELFAMLNGVTLEPGTYYVVVDGFDGETGNYGLFIEESEPMNMDPERYTVVGQLPSRMEKLDHLGYSKYDIQSFEERTELFLTNSNRTRSRDEHCPTLVSYKVYNTADNTLLSETTDTTYTHTGLDPAMDYCYSVSAVYEAGESEETVPVCNIRYAPDSKEELQFAVDMWREDSTTALMMFGIMDNWDVSLVTDMSSLFEGDTTFNRNISNWDVSNVTNMDGMFDSAFVFNQDLSSWDVSSVTDMHTMFWNAHSFEGNLSSWDVSNVTNMGKMFENANSFNSDLSGWNVSNVTNLYKMFRDATSFNQDLSSWDVSNVINMEQLFFRASVFTSDLSSWDVTNVTTMNGMFGDLINFTSDLSNWDVSNVTDMGNMFFGCTEFTSDLSSWNVSFDSDNVNVQYVRYVQRGKCF